MRIIVVVIGLVLGLLAGVFAETSAQPELTESQRLKLQNALQRVEITQLRMTLAQTEAQQAKVDAQTLLKTLVIEGWSLDLSTMTYVKAETAKK